MRTSLNSHVATTVAASPPRDAETQELVRQSLRLIVESERALAQLEDLVGLLRTFVDTAADEDDNEEGRP